MWLHSLKKTKKNMGAVRLHWFELLSLRMFDTKLLLHPANHCFSVGGELQQTLLTWNRDTTWGSKFACGWWQLGQCEEVPSVIFSMAVSWYNKHVGYSTMPCAEGCVLNMPFVLLEIITWNQSWNYFDFRFRLRNIIERNLLFLMVSRWQLVSSQCNKS